MDLINILENFTWYDKQNIEKHVSASSFSKEPLELWHMINKTKENPLKLNDATVGSIVHLGLEYIVKQSNEFKDGYIDLEKRLMVYVDDWTISGKPDAVDHKNKVIYDYKTGKNYSKKMVIKDGKYHPYAIQCAVYNWILGGEYKAKILWLMKDSDIIMSEPVIFEQEIEIMSPEETEKFIYDKLTLMENFTEEPPEKCKDTWSRKHRKKGFIADTKCAYYCQYSIACPKYNPSVIQSVSAW